MALRTIFKSTIRRNVKKLEGKVVCKTTKLEVPGRLKNTRIAKNIERVEHIFDLENRKL